MENAEKKLLVDTESGSIRLHRPHFFDPPWEKMKGIERERKKQNREERGPERRVPLRSAVGRKGRVAVGHCAMAAQLTQPCRQASIGSHCGLGEQNRLWDAGAIPGFF